MISKVAAYTSLSATQEEQQADDCVRLPDDCVGLPEEARTPGPIRRLPGTKSRDGTEQWVITRYADVVAALTDPRLSNTRVYARAAGEPPYNLQLDQTIAAIDPPDHTRLRKLVIRAFSTKRIEALRPQIQQIADRLFDTAATRERADLITEFAFPFPVRVISMLLGIPGEVCDQLLRESETPNGALFPELPRNAMYAALADLLRARRAQLTGDPLSDLAEAHSGGKLTDTELIQMAGMLLAAGYRTSVRLLYGGVLLLLRQPSQLTELRRDLTLMPLAAGEMIRHLAPAPALSRYALDDVGINGVTIPKGSHVTITLTAATRDPDVFGDPDTFDIRRPDGNDIGFGRGIHFCLGIHLAKVETEIFVGTLLRRFPGVSLVRESQGACSSHPAAICLDG